MSNSSGPGAESTATPGEGDPRRGVLTTEHEHLAAEIDELHVGDPTEVRSDNFADSGQVAAEQGESMALAGKLREQLDDVALALDKLDAGTYGLCETCGQPIGADRLEAMPAARFCIAHAG